MICVAFIFNPALFLPSHTVWVYSLLATAPVLLSHNSYCSSTSCRFFKGASDGGGEGGGGGGGGLVERLLGGRGCCPWGRSRGGLESHLVVIRVLRTTVTHGCAHSHGPAQQSITGLFSMYTRHCASCNDTALSHTHTHTHTHTHHTHTHTHTWTPGYTHLRGNCT